MTPADIRAGRRPAGAARAASIALSIAFGVLLVVLFVRSAQVVVTIPPSFDGAMNLQVAASVADGEGYRRNYAAREAFPHEIQTGVPYILPAAAVFRLFGVDIAQSEVVNVIYVALLLLAVALLVKEGGGLPLALFAACTVLLVPGVSEYGYFGYGEIPALAWALLAIVVYFRPSASLAMAFASGVLLALAVYTKTVMLIGAGALGLCAVLELADRRARTRSAVVRFVAFLCGGAVIIAITETWRALSLGGWHAWHAWWHIATRNIFMQAGVKPGLGGETHSVLQKFAVHFDLLGHDYRMSLVLTALWLAVVVIAFLFAVERLRTRRRWNWATLAVLLIGGVYLAWWLLLTPTSKAWHRRILDGMVATDIAVLMVAGPWFRAALSAAAGKRLRFVLATAGTIAAILPAVWLVKGAHTLLVAPVSPKTCALGMAEASACARFDPGTSVGELRLVSREVRALPSDAYVFAFGWYSAPRVGLFAQRHIVDFHDVPIATMQPGRPVYFVQGSATPPESLTRIRALYDVTAAPEHAYALIRAVSLTPRPLAAGTAPVKRYVQAADNYAYLRGFNDSEGANGRWSTDDNLVLLAPHAGDEFQLVAYVLAADQYEHHRLPNVLVSFNGCRASAQATRPNQVNRLLFAIPASCHVQWGAPTTVRIEVDNLVDSAITHDPRALGVLTKSFGFVAAAGAHAQP